MGSCFGCSSEEDPCEGCGFTATYQLAWTLVILTDAFQTWNYYSYRKPCDWDCECNPQPCECSCVGDPDPRVNRDMFIASTIFLIYGAFLLFYSTIFYVYAHWLKMGRVKELEALAAEHMTPTAEAAATPLPSIKEGDETVAEEEEGVADNKEEDEDRESGG